MIQADLLGAHQTNGIHRYLNEKTALSINILNQIRLLLTGKSNIVNNNISG